MQPGHKVAQTRHQKTTYARTDTHPYSRKSPKRLSAVQSSAYNTANVQAYEGTPTSVNRISGYKTLSSLARMKAVIGMTTSCRKHKYERGSYHESAMV